jgi:hypothetical protein
MEAIEVCEVCILWSLYDHVCLRKIIMFDLLPSLKKGGGDPFEQNYVILSKHEFLIQSSSAGKTVLATTIEQG